MTWRRVAFGIVASGVLVAGGASAGDYVAAEPVDFLKVCDAYGTGYFYIPGTETCLKLGGFGRVELVYDDSFPDEHYNIRTRARLNITGKSETDLGTLTSFVRVQGDTNTHEYSIFIATISLGGFSAGYDNSFYDYDGGYGGYTLERRGYRSDRALDYIGYAYAPKTGIGFFAAAEEPTKYFTVYPDIVAGVTYVAGPLDLRLSGAMVNEATGWAVQLGGSLKLDQIAKGDAVRFTVGFGENAGYFTAVDKAIGTSGGLLMGPSWLALLSARHYWKPTVVSAVTGAYVTAAGEVGWEVSSSLNISPAKGFWIGPEYTHIYNSTKAKPHRNIFMVRFQRDF